MSEEKIDAKFRIPRLVFHGTGFFSLCTTAYMTMYEPHKQVSSDSEPFMVPGLPGDIKLTRKQLPDMMKSNHETDITKMLKASKEAELKSYGAVINSFYELELEPAYADYYRNVLGMRAWHVGPVPLCNEDKASNGDFIRVVRKDKKDQLEKEDWLLEGFEKRLEGKGLIVRKWAPQVLILEHEAVGVFVTHCGWNSTLEGVIAGVGVQQWARLVRDFVKREAIEKAVKEVMAGDRAGEMRSRTKALGDMARRAIEKEGSSYSDLNALIEELSTSHD
ncbi:hypothetical protein EZV62_019351 [Acer yangbiense]|uniref:UDP-glycosyltransferases domain-containing protein n=1 Tax=Acer yangbiense TaxID=1000413 RepID=A0A5C7HC17_9ROSI|nr:hypothetical protein EZV62_019351 [Acer yangbiense]